MLTTYVTNPYPAVQPLLWALAINTLLFVAVSLNTRPNAKGAEEVVGALADFFKTRDNAKHKVIVVLICVLYFQAIVGPFLLPADALVFEWMPLPILNVIFLTVECSVIGYYYAMNRLYEPDGSAKEFLGAPAAGN
jgi:hypothetical protein